MSKSPAAVRRGFAALNVNAALCALGNSVGQNNAVNFTLCSCQRVVVAHVPFCKPYGVGAYRAVIFNRCKVELYVISAALHNYQLVAAKASAINECIAAEYLRRSITSHTITATK